MEWVTVNGKKLKMKRIVIDGREIWTTDPKRTKEMIERRKGE